MMDAVFVEDGTVLFETGMFYWPAGDVTVELHVDFLAPLGSWTPDTFTYSWIIDVYQGDVIGVDDLSSNGLNDDNDDQVDEPDEEDEDFIDTFDDPICEGTIQLTGTRPLQSRNVAGPMLYAGSLQRIGDQGNDLPVRLVCEPEAGVVRVFGASDPAPLGRFSVLSGGTFRGPFLSGYVGGRLSTSRVLAAVELTDSAGRSHMTTLEMSRME